MADHRQGLFNKGAFLRAWNMVRRAIIPPDRWNAFVMDVAAALQQAMITDVVGGTFQRTAAGTVIVCNPGGGGGSSASFTFKLIKVIKGTNAFLQVNGSDDLAAALNGIYARVNGNPNNVQIGSPLAWPVLAIAGNGPVYAYVTLVTTLGITTVTQVDIFQEGSAQTPLTDGQTYAWILLGSVTNYATNGAGVPSFTLLNAQSTGFSQFAVCNGGYNVW